jgi:hypothetical protein
LSSGLLTTNEEDGIVEKDCHNGMIEEIYNLAHRAVSKRNCCGDSL